MVIKAFHKGSAETSFLGGICFPSRPTSIKSFLKGMDSGGMPAFFKKAEAPGVFACPSLSFATVVNLLQLSVDAAYQLSIGF